MNTYDRDSSDNFRFAGLLQAKTRMQLGLPVYIAASLHCNLVDAELVDWEVKSNTVILDLESVEDGVPFYQELELAWADALTLHADGWLQSFPDQRISESSGIALEP